METLVGFNKVTGERKHLQLHSEKVTKSTKMSHVRHGLRKSRHPVRAHALPSARAQ